MIRRTLRSGISVSVSLDRNVIAIGGAEDNDTVGATWVYVYNGSTYQQLGSKLVASNASGPSQQGIKGKEQKCISWSRERLYDYHDITLHFRLWRESLLEWERPCRRWCL